MRIIIGKERESYEPELNYTGCVEKAFSNESPEMERWKTLHSVKDLGVGIANYIELVIYKTIKYKLFAV